MAGEEPPFLPVGTEVSAKYRGAFCEAKVKKIVKNVKCKITIKEGNIRMVVQDDDLRGTVKVGHIVDVQQEQGQFVACVVNKITDCSTYTVVFDDGDENTLRRTQLCLKGEKHFVKSDTLDELPLTHPEHFGTPVMRGARGKPKLFNQNVSSDSESDLETTDDETIPGQNPRVTEERHYSHKLLGLVVCLEIEDRKKTMWVPALVVQPSADSTELKTSDHLLVKSFRDSKFYAALQKDVKEFTRDMAMKNEDKVLKVAFEKALQYYDTHELPQTWEKDELLGSESDDHSDSSEDDEEPSEERDRFVAQLYKFMDDRGTPMNKSPQVAGQDLNLYKMFGLVHSMGGYNKVTNQMKWHVIYSKMNLPGTTSSSAANQIKAAYKKYLHAFEDFDRKLGCTMGTSTRPRARHSSGRNILSFRERDRESQPKSPRSLKKNTDAEEEETPSAKDVSDRSDVESIKGDTQRKTRSEDNKFVNSSESETDSTHSNRPMTRDKKSAKPATRESVKVTETSGRPTREEAPRRAKEEAIAIRIAKEEDRKMAKEEKDTADDKDESKQPKKRGRNRDEETATDEKKISVSKKQKDDTSSEVSEDIKTDSDKEDEETDKNKAEYDVGVRLKIKYGRGKNMKVYEAKIIDTRIDGNSAQYKVHYAGWNTRYDEWLKKDRIVGPVAGQTLRKPTKAKANSDTTSNSTPKPSAENTIKPLASNAAKSTPTASITTSRPVASIITSKTPSCVSAKSTPSASITTSKTPANITAKSTPKVTMTPTPQSVKRLITRKLINRLTPVSSDPKPAPKDKEPIIKSKTEPSKAAVTAAAATTQKLAGPVTPKVQRPTRSTSVESNLATGLKHSKRQPKKPASVTESETQSRVSDSEESDSAEDESSEEEVKERITRSRADAEAKSPKDTTASMPESEHIKQEVLVPQKTEPTVTEKPSESIESTENTEKETKSEEEQVLAAVESAPEKMKVKVPEKVKVLEKVKVPEKVKIPEKVKVPDTTVEDQTVKEETKTDKKIDDKIYDFEDSSSQDSFKEGSSAKEAIDKGRFRRKELPKRVRKTSTDSIASNDSVTKATGSKPVVNSEPEIPKPTKEIINRSVKKSDDKPLITKTVEVEKEKKKPGPKPKEVPETPTKDTTIKGKGIQKTDKPRGKRKADAPDAPNKPDEGEKKKKVKKKKEEDTESKPSETHRVKTSSQSSSDTVSTVSSSESPEKPPEVVSLPDPSMSPPYMPAPILMQTVSIEVKPEGSVEELAPQLSPITAAGVSTAISPSHVPVLESRDPELDPEPVAPVEPIPDTVSKDEPSSTAYVNTPPDTPVASPRGEPQVMTPEHKPEEPTPQPQPQPQPDPEQVPEALPPFAPPTGSSVAGGDSPTTCDTSTVSNGSGGSSGNAPGSESEDPSAGITTGDTTPNLKRTMEEEVEEEEEEDKSPPKRRKRRQTKNTEKCYNKKSGSNKQSMSDSDEQDSLVKSPEPLTSVSVRSNTSASSSPAAHRTQPIQRVPKYNFLNLEDGKYLEGEERIRFLMGKITDIRKLYITLKSEVACIDRRRKRHRRKMHDAAAAAAAAAAVAAVVSRGEQEML